MCFKVWLATSSIHLHSIILKGQSRRERKDKSDRQNCFKLPLKTHKLYWKQSVSNFLSHSFFDPKIDKEMTRLIFLKCFLLQFAICIFFTNELLPHLLFVSSLLFCFLQLLKHLVLYSVLKQNKHLWEHPVRNWRTQLDSKG